MTGEFQGVNFFKEILNNITNANQIESIISE